MAKSIDHRLVELEQRVAELEEQVQRASQPQTNNEVSDTYKQVIKEIFGDLVR